jgi:RNA polymerase sigma factor (sigma-70 family)
MAIDGESSFDLLERIRTGDPHALDALLGRHLPSLRRWASGRLPKWARDLADTDDLVQETVIHSVKHLQTFETRREGALQAYLRQAVMNRIRNEFRRAKRHPAPLELEDRHPDEGASPLEAAIGREALERYDAGLAALRDEDREVIVARIELGYSFEEVADALDKPSADAARVALNRALVRLAEQMKAFQPARHA